MDYVEESVKKLFVSGIKHDGVLVRGIKAYRLRQLFVGGLKGMDTAVWMIVERDLKIPFVHLFAESCRIWK